MIKVYDDGSVYIGEMKDGLRCGQGTYYMLSDFFAGSKISGNWQNDKLNGWAKISTLSSCLEGPYKDGVKNGLFFRDDKDGMRCAVKYIGGVYVSDEIYSRSRKHNNQYDCLGYVDLGENSHFIGEVYDNQPYGYGVIYVTNENQQITNKYFCKMYGKHLAQSIDISSKGQEESNLI